MRYMVMHKVDALMEAGKPPREGVIAEMGRLIGRSKKEGVFLDGAGLHRSATRARVLFADGQPTIVRGPYAGGNELVACFAMIATTGLEAAIDLAIQLGKAVGKPDVEIEIGPVVEAWDLTGGTRPANAAYRYLLFVKADATTEGGAPPVAPAVRTLFERWKRDGILHSEASLGPSRRAVRTKVDAGQRRWFDGPFTESKELVAGFSIIDVPSLDDAKRFTTEYAAILGDNEVDIREVGTE